MKIQVPSIHDAGSGSPKIFTVHLFSFSLFSSTDPFQPLPTQFPLVFVVWVFAKTLYQRPTTEYTNTYQIIPQKMVFFFCFNQTRITPFDTAMVFRDQKSDIARLQYDLYLAYR